MSVVPGTVGMDMTSSDEAAVDNFIKAGFLRDPFGPPAYKNEKKTFKMTLAKSGKQVEDPDGIRATIRHEKKRRIVHREKKVFETAFDRLRPGDAEILLGLDDRQYRILPPTSSQLDRPPLELALRFSASGVIPAKEMTGRVTLYSATPGMGSIENFRHTAENQRAHWRSDDVESPLACAVLRQTAMKQLKELVGRYPPQQVADKGGAWVQAPENDTTVDKVRFYRLLKSIRKSSLSVVERFSHYQEADVEMIPLVERASTMKNHKIMVTYVKELATDLDHLDREPFLSWLGFAVKGNPFLSIRKLDGSTAKLNAVQVETLKTAMQSARTTMRQSRQMTSLHVKAEGKKKRQTTVREEIAAEAQVSTLVTLTLILLSFFSPIVITLLNTTHFTPSLGTCLLQARKIVHAKEIEQRLTIIDIPREARPSPEELEKINKYSPILLELKENGFTTNLLTAMAGTRMTDAEGRRREATVRAATSDNIARVLRRIAIGLGLAGEPTRDVGSVFRAWGIIFIGMNRMERARDFRTRMIYFRELRRQITRFKRYRRFQHRSLHRWKRNCYRRWLMYLLWCRRFNRVLRRAHCHTTRPCFWALQDWTAQHFEVREYKYRKRLASQRLIFVYLRYNIALERHHLMRTFVSPILSKRYLAYHVWLQKSVWKWQQFTFLSRQAFAPADAALRRAWMRKALKHWACLAFVGGSNLHVMGNLGRALVKAVAKQAHQSALQMQTWVQRAANTVGTSEGRQAARLQTNAAANHLRLQARGMRQRLSLFSLALSQLMSRPNWASTRAQAFVARMRSMREVQEQKQKRRQEEGGEEASALAVDGEGISKEAMRADDLRGKGVETAAANADAVTTAKGVPRPTNFANYALVNARRRVHPK
jgi:hypothetical protein